MAVLVTRPHPDNETTAATLRARGFEVLLAPMLRFESLAFPGDPDADYAAIIVTSANALRGFESHPEARRLLTLPLFAVGEHTADAARRVGFGTVSASKGGVNGLRDEVIARAKAGNSIRPARCFTWREPTWRAISPATSARAALTWSRTPRIG